MVPTSPLNGCTHWHVVAQVSPGMRSFRSGTYFNARSTRTKTGTIPKKTRLEMRTIRTRWANDSTRRRFDMPSRASCEYCRLLTLLPWQFMAVTQFRNNPFASRIVDIFSGVPTPTLHARSPNCAQSEATRSLRSTSLSTSSRLSLPGRPRRRRSKSHLGFTVR